MPCVPGDAYYTFRPGDANCLPDNVNCDGNLWYRGKVDTSEVFFCFLFDNSNTLTSFLACDIFELEHVDYYYHNLDHTTSSMLLATSMSVMCGWGIVMLQNKDKTIK